MENTEKDNKVSTTIAFKDEKGNDKFLKLVRGTRKYTHTGNENYLLTNNGVVNHPTKRIIKKILHSIK